MPFGLSPLHVVIVLVVALIVLGPQRLPEMGASLGRSIREFRDAIRETADASEVGSSFVAPPSAGDQAQAPEILPGSPSPQQH
jgi:sec-independent protein translocase protein TatA